MGVAMSDGTTYELAARPSALAVFTARASARAVLFAANKIDLPEAVDRLQAAAERDGLLAEIGQDEVQAIMATAFAAVRDEPTSFAEAAWTAPGWREAAGAYHEKRDGQTLTVEIESERLDRLRGLLADGVSLKRAFAQINKLSPGDMPTATLQAAEFLLQQKDRARMRAWLSRHGADERAGVFRHLDELRKKARG
jgi:hypothetical protein